MCNILIFEESYIKHSSTLKPSHMKSSGDLGSSNKKKSSYIYIGFFIIAILSMLVVIWQMGMLD